MNTQHTPLSEITEAIEPLLVDLISGFISFPEELKVECARVGGMLQFNIDGNPDDMPKIAGKMYQNLGALQIMFNAMLRPIGFSMKIHLEDRSRERSRGANTARFKNNPEWPRDDFMGLLTDVLDALCEQTPDIREQIIKPRELRFGARTVMSIADESVFHITPAYDDLLVFTNDVEIAIELIFRAIGQQQGRRVTISFTNAQQGSS